MPIPGAKRIAHLEQNSAAASLALKAEDLALLSRTFDPAAISGGRYSAAMEAMAER
ncbi:hypothetical protein [Thioclava sp. GXIMD4215]|uniref:hypothetical protein n=1 Tax=Thioclava sp. GXIMD4215 TaxID=3131928 RepID=UPI00311AC66A